MTPGLTSVIIPCHNHAAYVADAVKSALDQTVPVEVLIVDDGSTDEIELAVARLLDDERVTFLRQQHKGVAAARNFGIDMASGEFLQFLDADDTIEPTKLELQQAVMDDDHPWVLSDTRIIAIDDKKSQLASERYQYAKKRLDGWVEPWLAVANFMPVHAPLVRRSVVGDIRFPLGVQAEDWAFWYAVSKVARLRYTPAILATYRKRRNGRNAKQMLSGWKPRPPGPLMLNLGCGNPDARSWHPMQGMVNLDKSLGWEFEGGLPQYKDGEVEAITISHALMYLDDDQLIWHRAFQEFWRVLRPGGRIRITEDDTENPASRTYKTGWQGSEPCRTKTGPSQMRKELGRVGFIAVDVSASTNASDDGKWSCLRQDQHGGAPHCFFIEGIKPCAVLLSPHSDDECLFSAYNIIRHRPLVVICFPSSGDYGDTATRTSESAEAVAMLGGVGVEQWDGQDIEAKMRDLDERMHPTIVFAPDMDASHADHRAVAAAAAVVFTNRVRWYHTYQEHGKVRAGLPVPHEPGWAEKKREALKCYRTQLEHPRAQQFFAWDLAEYAP